VWTPIVEHADEPALGEVRLHLVLGQVRQPNPARAAFNLRAMLLNTNCPSTRIFSSRPFFSNSQA
jgi:hypothetical protein